MRLPNTAHTSRPWRIHELTCDFRLEDVWALPTSGGPDEFPQLVRLMASGERSQGGSSRAACALWAQLGDPKVMMVETVGVLAFGALALGALLADGRLAQYLLAAAWLGHGAWDFAHHRANKVVPRWYAELCAVLDVMVAIGILLAIPYL